MSIQPNLESKNKSSASRKKVVRQDRHTVIEFSHVLKTDFGNYKIDNYAAFGLAIKNEFPKEKTIEPFNAVYVVEGQEVQDLKVKYVRNDDVDLIAFTILDNPLEIDAIQSIEAAHKQINIFEKNLKNNETIPIEFRRQTLDFKNWMQNLSNNINQIEKTTFDSPLKSLNYFEESVSLTVSSYLDQKLPDFIKEMTQVLTKMDKDTLNKSYDYLRKEVGVYFYNSSYGNRIYSKPRGYAGDYEMMNNVYYNELRGTDLFGKCMQRLYTNSSAGKAVRNRADYLLKKLVNLAENNNSLKILSVASGPSRELQLFIQNYPQLVEKCEFHLLDQDEEALKFSQKELYDIARKNKVKLNITFHHLGIKNVITDGLWANDFDLIYSAGLFDYFTDPVAQFASSKLYNGLKKSGQLIIGNFNTNNPSQFLMEALGDWYLIYRDKDTLKKLFKHLNANMEIEEEAENVNLFVVIKHE